MENNFEIGDKVEIIDDNIRGVVKKVLKDEVLVSCEDGLEIEFEVRQLVKIEGDIKVDWRDFSQFKKIEKKHKPSQNKSQKSKIGNTTVWKIDLHIEKLLPPQKMREIIPLEYQLRHAEYTLNQAMSKGVQNIIFIHGVGDGILRAELETIFSRYNEVKFSDADYKEYGLGAMHVYIIQSKKK